MDEWVRLQDYLPAASRFSDHKKECCAIARGWLRAMDRSHSFREGGWLPPTWLRVRYAWGPVRWPLFWCQLPTLSTLDCGSLAALSTKLFNDRGEIAVSVQLILRYHRLATAGWSSMWERAGLCPVWIHGKYCYHEATAIVRQGSATIWDSTESRWVEPDNATRQAYAGLVALRLGSDKLQAPEIITWGENVLPLDKWVDISERE